MRSRPRPDVRSRPRPDVRSRPRPDARSGGPAGRPGHAGGPGPGHRHRPAQGRDRPDRGGLGLRETTRAAVPARHVGTADQGADRRRAVAGRLAPATGERAAHRAAGTRRALGDPGWVVYADRRHALSAARPRDCDVDNSARPSRRPARAPGRRRAAESAGGRGLRRRIPRGHGGRGMGAGAPRGTRPRLRVGPAGIAGGTRPRAATRRPRWRSAASSRRSR